MGLFGKKKLELPPLISDDELEPPVNFDSVIQYLEGLNRYEYEKLLKVVNIWRKANQEVNRLLPQKVGPVINAVISEASPAPFITDDEAES